MDRIRIGVIGLGFGQYLVRTLAHLEGAQLVAVADQAASFPEGLEAYAARYGAKAYHDGFEMLATEALDALVVATSPQWRAAIIERAAQQHIPLFVEKPWATNLAHARTLAEICQRHDARVMVGFSFRFLPAIVYLKTLIQGELGQGRLLNGNYTFGWTPPPDHWLWDPDNGNGFFNENSCHMFDAVCYLMGRPVSVMAEAGNFSGSPSEDSAAVTLKFEQGGIAALTLGGIGTGAIKQYPRINVYTAHGQALLAGHEHIWDSVTWGMHGQATTQIFAGAAEALGNTRYTPAFQHFITCVREGRDPSATVEDGILAVALAEAVYESARTGRKVPINV